MPFILKFGGTLGTNGGGRLAGDSTTSPSSGSEICRDLAVIAGASEAPDDLVGCSVFTFLEGAEGGRTVAETSSSVLPEVSNVLREPLDCSRLDVGADFGERAGRISSGSAAARGDEVTSRPPLSLENDCNDSSEMRVEAGIGGRVASVGMGECVFWCWVEAVEFESGGDPTGRWRIAGI